jgi:hypothetical protein
VLAVPVKVVVIFTEPLYGNVVVTGTTSPLLEKVSTTTAYAVVCCVASSLPKEDEMTIVEKPVESRFSFA